MSCAGEAEIAGGCAGMMQSPECDCGRLPALGVVFGVADGLAEGVDELAGFGVGAEVAADGGEEGERAEALLCRGGVDEFDGLFGCEAAGVGCGRGCRHVGEQGEEMGRGVCGERAGCRLAVWHKGAGALIAALGDHA